MMENLSRKTSRRITKLLEEISHGDQNCEELAIRAEEMKFCLTSFGESTEIIMDIEKKKINFLEEQLLTIIEKEMELH